MEKKVVKEAKNVPDSIIIVLYRTYTGYANGEVFRFNTVMSPEDSIRWTERWNLDSIKPIPTTLKIKNNEK